MPNLKQRLSNLFLFLIFIKILNIEKGRRHPGPGMLWAVVIMEMVKDPLQGPERRADGAIMSVMYRIEHSGACLNSLGIKI